MPNSFKPDDPLYSSQWHLGMIGQLGYGADSSAFSGLERVWADYRGQGVTVGIWDTGVQQTHWDLDANYNASRQVTISGTLNNGQPLTSSDGHGTSVAGLIAAENNGLGGIGIAFKSQITAIRIFGGQDDINSAWARYLLTLDSLGNFDVTNHSYGKYPNFTVAGDVAKFANASAYGRHGLGTINIKSAGNNNIDGNGDALDASRHTITVAAIDSTGIVAQYSTYGAHILVSAPAGAVTTDLLGTGTGYDGLLNGDYTNQFGGTSAAGPVTVGVVTLMLSANKSLGWRDVQNILAYSSLGAGSLYGGAKTNENLSWKWNGADNWNGGGLHYSEDYGYGIVNAFNAVRMAEVWSIMYPTAATSLTEAVATTGTITFPAKTIADLATSTFTFNVSEIVSLEHVDLTINLTHSNFTNLRISLISPEGTTMSLYNGSTGNASTSDYGLTYTFGIDGLRGESSLGDWKLLIRDAVKNDSGTLNSIAFTGYGSTANTNDVYHYTDEVLTALAATGQSARLTLSDTDGGTDWIDAAAMYRDLELDLRENSTSTLAGNNFLTIAAGSKIENAIAGDGNDKLTGNALDNVLYGMRGNDSIYGLAGNDTMDGGSGTDTACFSGNYSSYIITHENGVTTVSGPEGTDTLINFEYLQFADHTISDPSAVPNDTIHPLLLSSSPTDNATAVASGANIVLTFNESVQAGTGSFVIYNAGGTVWKSISATDSSQVYISFETVTINPVDNLAPGSKYYVLIENTALKDFAGNNFDGISVSTVFNFETDLNYNTITGTNAANILNGTDGDDRIFGLLGNDSLYGNAGNDLLDGGGGSDRMAGGSGNDIYIVDNSGDTVIENANAGTDTVRTSLPSYTLGSNVENLEYTGTQVFTGTGNTLANSITGNTGNDLLNGKEGNDRLTGGSGSDIFRFDTLLNASTNVDTLVDFTSNLDKIQLENSIFKKLIATGALLPANLVSSSDGKALDANDYILFNSTTHALSYDADGSGSGAAIQFATLIGVTSVTASDFVVT
ncbi:MAG: hypothetical protein FDX21_09650 [Chlorobium sp.]|nr:MAG: hypothetical protein FDX21_09650 [Chlorobium sp.]